MTDDQKDCIKSADNGALETGCGESFKEKVNALQKGVSIPQTPKVELYIGCKVIKATPMSSDEFKKFKGLEIGMEENASGYKVEYEDGYISWSPAWTFENAYRKLSNGERKLLSI